jgi:hypothetical protein
MGILSSGWEVCREVPTSTLSAPNGALYISLDCLGDVTYVIPWTRLSYDTNDGGYHGDITEADLRSALLVAQEDVDWADREAGEAFFRIPPGWRSV